MAGQALLLKKTLRRKVSLVEHYIRWANVCQGKVNELTDVLKAPGLRDVEVQRGFRRPKFCVVVPAGRDSRLRRVGLTDQ